MFLFGLIFLLFIILLIPCLWTRGKRFIFCPSVLLKSSFPARSSELMRVWPPVRRTVCAVKCKGTRKRHKGKCAGWGMPKNQGAQWFASNHDRLGLPTWTCANLACVACALCSRGARARKLPKPDAALAALGWFPLCLCFALIKTGHLHCWCFILFGARIMPCHQGLGWKPKGRRFP